MEHEEALVMRVNFVRLQYDLRNTSRLRIRVTRRHLNADQENTSQRHPKENSHRSSNHLLQEPQEMKAYLKTFAPLLAVL